MKFPSFLLTMKRNLGTSGLLVDGAKNVSAPRVVQYFHIFTLGAEIFSKLGFLRDLFNARIILANKHPSSTSTRKVNRPPRQTPRSLQLGKHRSRRVSTHCYGRSSVGYGLFSSSTHDCVRNSLPLSSSPLIHLKSNSVARNPIRPRRCRSGRNV